MILVDEVGGKDTRAYRVAHDAGRASRNFGTENPQHARHDSHGLVWIGEILVTLEQGFEFARQVEPYALRGDDGRRSPEQC